MDPQNGSKAIISLKCIKFVLNCFTLNLEDCFVVKVVETSGKIIWVQNKITNVRMCGIYIKRNLNKIKSLYFQLNIIYTWNTDYLTIINM